MEVAQEVSRNSDLSLQFRQESNVVAQYTLHCAWFMTFFCIIIGSFFLCMHNPKKKKDKINFSGAVG